MLDKHENTKDPNQVFSADEIYELWTLLLQAGWSLFELRNAELQPSGITTMHAAILFFMQAIGNDATPAEIARWILRKPNTVSAMLDRMEKSELIVRSKDMPKKNRVRITMTEKGREALQASLERKSIHRVFSLLSDDERQRLRAYLNIIRNATLMELRKSPHNVPFPQDKIG